MFSFKECFYYDKNNISCIDDEKFEDLFIKWYDNGKSDYNFTDLDGEDNNLTQYLFYEYDPIDRIEGDQRRWNQWVEHIIEIKKRYFSVGCDVGLTELQENEFYSDSIIKEVVPRKEVKIITIWEQK